jgi:hypothetical protein
VLVIIEDSLHSFIFTWPVIEGIGDFASIQMTNQRNFLIADKPHLEEI